MKKWISLLLSVCLVLLCPGAAFAEVELRVAEEVASRIPAIEAYECQSEKMEAELLPDGTMQMTEYWTFSCKRWQKMTKFSHTIPKSDRYTISDIIVKQGNSEYKRLPDFDESRPPHSYAVRETDTGYDLGIYYYIENQSIGVKIGYTVKGAMTFHADTAEFQWQFINDKIPYDVQRFTGMVILPVGAERKELKMWTHGLELPHSLTADSGELITLSVEDLPAFQAVDIRVAAPLRLFSPVGNTTGQNAYQRILEEENDPAANPAYVAREEKKDRIIRTAAPAVILAGAAILLFFDARRRRRERSETV